MNQLLLERSLENKFTPTAVKRSVEIEMYQQPTRLAKILAQESLKRISIKVEK